MARSRCASEILNGFSVAALVCTLFITSTLHWTIAESANEDIWPYLEVYPSIDATQDQLSCVPSENVTCPLYVAVTMSFGGEYLSSGVIGSIQYALDQINNDSSLLPGYSLHYTLADSRVSCKKKKYRYTCSDNQIIFHSATEQYHWTLFTLKSSIRPPK